MVYGAIAANFGIAVAKFVAAALTGSSAMLSEGFHSLVDTGNQGLLLLGVHQGRHPPDEGHPFGHGRALYFWSLVVAIVLFGVGGGLSLYEGITHVINPAPLEDPLVAYIVLAVAVVLEGSSFLVAAHEILPDVREEGMWQAFRTSKDPSTLTVLAEDSAAVTGLVLAAAGIAAAHLFDEPRLDGAASIAIGVLLALVALLLARESRGLLIGERADEAAEERLRAAVERVPSVARLASMRTMHLGPDEILVTLRVEPAPGADPIAAIDAARASIRDAEPRATDITIEPARERGAASA